MPTIRQNIKRLPLPIILLFYFIIFVSCTTIFLFSGIEENTLLTYLGVAAAFYYGHNQIFKKETEQEFNCFRENMISAAENAHLFKVDNGFFVQRTSDKKFNIVIAWKIIYKIPLDVQDNLQTVDSRDNYNFYVFSRVFSGSEDYKKVVSENLKPRILMSLHWWDHYTQISRINDRYSGGLIRGLNSSRKSLTQLRDIHDVDYLYAREAIAEIHSFGFHKMMRCKEDGEKYQVKYLYSYDER